MAETHDEQDLEPLPEPEPGGEDAPDPDFSDLLVSFEADSGLDGAESADLEDGIELEEYAGAVADSEEQPVDIGEIPEPVELASPVEGDDFGPTDDGGTGITEVEPLGLDGGEEGSDTPEDLLEGDLPSLDDDDEDGTEAEETATLGPAEDESAPPHADPPWIEVALAHSVSRSLVTHASGGRMASGTDIMLVDDDGRTSALVGNAGGTVTSLVADRDHGIVYATRAGELFRASKGGNPERLAGWLEAGGLDRRRIFGVTVGGPTPSSRPALLLHVVDERGSLLESTDHGNTWRRVDLGGPVHSLSTGTPPVVLVRAGREFCLFRSEPTGGFTAVTTLAPEDPDSLRVSVQGSVIAVLEPDRGVRVSADSGAVFRPAVGSLRATAVASGFVAGQPSVFVALFEVASGRAQVAWVDAVGGEGTLIGGIEVSDDDEGDVARVAALSWDPSSETLWAAGAFGLRCWRRPPSA